MLVSPQLLQEAAKKVNFIKEKIKAAQEGHKSYADDSRRKELEFKVGNSVYLKVSPLKGCHKIWFLGKTKA